jgi:hypothetical protein
MARRERPFKGRQFTSEVILWAVRWYLQFPISYRDLELMLRDRGVPVDHTTLYRWIQAYAVELEKRLRPHLRPTNGSWRVDETLILSANSGSRCQGSEARDTRLGAGPAVEPVHDPRHIHRGGDANLLKPSLCQPNVAAATHAEGTDALRERAFHPGPGMVVLLPGGLAIRTRAALSASYSARGWK